MNWKEWNIISQNEQFWTSYEEKGILKAEYIKDYVLELWFEDDYDVSIYELDFSPLLIDDDPGNVFLFLKNKENFKNAKANYALLWDRPNENVSVDMAPECIRFFCERYGKVIKEKSKKIITV